MVRNNIKSKNCKHRTEGNKKEEKRGERENESLCALYIINREREGENVYLVSLHTYIYLIIITGKYMTIRTASYKL